eukprot:14585097-Ditylum_brightwellii.AAC.1
MLTLDSTNQGGPIYFLLMMEVILSLNGKARQSMIDHLKNISLQNFDSENMDKATTQILGADCCLELINIIPIDIMDI